MQYAQTQVHSIVRQSLKIVSCTVPSLHHVLTSACRRQWCYHLHENKERLFLVPSAPPSLCSLPPYHCGRSFVYCLVPAVRYCQLGLSVFSLPGDAPSLSSRAAFVEAQSFLYFSSADTARVSHLVVLFFKLQLLNDTRVMRSDRQPYNQLDALLSLHSCTHVSGQNLALRTFRIMNGLAASANFRCVNTDCFKYGSRRG